MSRRAHTAAVTEFRLPAPTVAGFQLVRRLGSGTRAHVYLGVAPSGTAAIKIYHPETGRHSIAQELAALGRVDSSHCVRLLDVAEDDDGTPVAVLSRVTAGSVARVLLDRGTIGLGEAVTILAPIAGLLPELHSCGVAHGAISAATVHFGDKGEPVLLGFGRSSLFVPNSSPALLATVDAVVGDRERLALMAGFVLDRVDTPSGAEPLRRWLEALPRPLSAGFAVELEQRLFDRAGATAVDLPMPGSQRTTGTRQPSQPAEDENGAQGSKGLGISGERPSRHSRPAQASQHSRPQGPRRAWVAAALGGSPLRRLRSRLTEGIRSVRRPVWIFAGIVATATAALVPLATTGSIGTEPGGAPGGTSESNSAQTGTTAAEAHGDAAVSSAGGDPVALADDPVEALPLLLAERTRCIADLSVLCLDSVDQAGSTALADDRALIDGLLAGTAADYREVEGTSPVLRERLGDSALLTVGEQSSPASVLMIRTEAGWRVREIRAR
jgi:serine/threonine protein kinase